jgi:hypothetical protein
VASIHVSLPASILSAGLSASSTIKSVSSVVVAISSIKSMTNFVLPSQTQATFLTQTSQSLSGISNSCKS